MIRGDNRAKPPRQVWSRTYINQQVLRIRHMFKWAASYEMVPITVYQQLTSVESLRRGQPGVRENPPIKPVSLERVEAIRPYVSRQVNALIDLQLLTGARGGELFQLRPMDLDKNDESGVWTYSPIEHKTAYRGHNRTIFFGPKAQAIHKPFLRGRPTNVYLFSSAEADIERRRTYPSVETCAHWLRLMPRIAKKLGFQMGTLVEARPRNDNQWPNSCFCY